MLFVIANETSYDWDDVNEHIERVEIVTNRGFNEIHHWQDWKTGTRAFETLKQTIESDHMFLLYKDFQNHRKIDQILHAVYAYKTRMALDPAPLLDALVKTDCWVPKIRFSSPYGYIPAAEHRKFFR